MPQSVIDQLASRAVRDGDPELAAAHAMDFARRVHALTRPVPEDGHSRGVYVERLGWLVDSSGVWSHDVREAQTFPSVRACREVLDVMRENGLTDHVGETILCPRLS